MDAAGWSQAESSRRLELTTGAISQLYNGLIRPSRQTIKLMKLMIASENPEAITAEEKSSLETPNALRSPVDTSCDQLKFIHRHDKPAYKSIDSMIKICYTRASEDVKRQETNLTDDERLKIGLQRAVDSVTKPGVAYLRSHKAASTSGKTSSPSSSERERPKTRQ